jgi:hypothetical protein
LIALIPGVKFVIWSSAKIRMSWSALTGIV